MFGIASNHRDTVGQKYALGIYSRFDEPYVMVLRREKINKNQKIPVSSPSLGNL